MGVRHGLTGTRVYKTWESMKARCYNPNDGKYPNYGGRGIKVCDEWLHDAGKFAEWAYANGFDENKHQGEQSIDRIDVNGNYCPENCRFTNATVQSNNRTNSIYLEFNGENRTISEWEKITGIKEGTIRFRLRKGWSVEDTLTKKVAKKKNLGKPHMVEYKGQKKTVAEWAKEKNIPYHTLSARLLRHGWTIEKALETPVGADKWHKQK